MKIYVASSWRNDFQNAVVQLLAGLGHEVYDFKNPAPGNNGFGWREISPDWQNWKAEPFREALEHPTAARGFDFDMNALMACDACVLVLPCGRSAHLELGWAKGAGKKAYALVLDALGPHEPELMYKMLDGICVNLDELVRVLS